MKPLPDPTFNVTAYAWVLSGTFSLQEDMVIVEKNLPQKNKLRQSTFNREFGCQFTTDSAIRGPNRLNSSEPGFIVGQTAPC